MHIEYHSMYFIAWDKMYVVSVVLNKCANKTRFKPVKSTSAENKSSFRWDFFLCCSKVLTLRVATMSTWCCRVSFLPLPCVCWLNYCRLDRNELARDKNLLISLFSDRKFRVIFTEAREKGIRWKCDTTTRSWSFFSKNILLLFSSHKIELLLWNYQQIYCEVCTRIINLFPIRFFLFIELRV